MKKTIYFLTALIFVVTISKAQINYIDSYIGNTATVTTIATISNSVNKPRDLDFKPNTNELWVANYGNSAGGSVVIIYNAGQTNQASEYRHDDHSDHFFYYPSAIAFGKDGQFGAVSEIQNTSSSATTFMGPSLWTADTAIFAKVWQNNWASGYPLGSHTDMLHQSPYSMGIAHDTLKAYWVMDGWNGNICKYDFIQDHGPGYDDHSAGKIWRYSDVTVTRVPQVPSHMVLDKTNGWLYFIDGGSKKIKRMDINSGSFSSNLSVPATANEPLAGYYKYLGATVETIDSLTTQPCGIDYYNGRLVVSDFTTGDIYIYSTVGAVTLLDTIVTGLPGMMGIKIGPDGHIWCVNKTDNKVYRIDAALPNSDAAILNITSPIITNFKANFYSTKFDICNGSITPTVNIANTGNTTITSMEIHYALDGGVHTIFNWSGSLAVGNSSSISLPTGTVTSGSHQLEVMIMMVNGMADDIELNNTLSGSFRAFNPVQSLPFTENFSSTTFPPTNWSYVNFNPNNDMSHAFESSFGVGSGSVKMDNYSGNMNIIGQKDYLMSPILDFTSAPSNTYLQFDVAYAQYTATDNDELKVSASTDCGNTWSTIYDKAGTILKTAAPYTSAWAPSTSQWRAEAVNIASLSGQSEVMLMFTSISNYGNNVFFDNIFIGASNVGIDETSASASFNVFPNPTTDFVNIQLSSQTDSKIFVANVLGEKIFSQQIPSAQKNIQIITSEWSNGVYFITQQSGKIISTQKVLVQHQ